jgi:hypothetical protein
MKLVAFLDLHLAVQLKDLMKIAVIHELIVLRNANVLVPKYVAVISSWQRCQNKFHWTPLNYMST